MDDPAFHSEVDLATQELILAASNHDISKLRALLRNSDSNVQDTESGYTPLHAAIASCEPDTDEQQNGISGQHPEVNGDDNEVETETESHSAVQSERQKTLDAAAETVRFLFHNGASWIVLDKEGETPGCLARRLGLKEIYDIIVDQGVRLELLATRSDQYQVLHDESDAQPQDGDATNEHEPAVQSAADDMNDAVAEAVENFLPDIIPEERVFHWSSAEMHAITVRTAELALPRDGLRLLSVEPSPELFRALCSRKPSVHHVFDSKASLDNVLAEISPTEKEGLLVHVGDSTITIPRAIEAGEITPSNYDAIVFWTTNTAYSEFRCNVLQWAELLDENGGPDGEGGLFTFFTHFGDGHQVTYDVYTKLVEMDLFEDGFDIDWETIPVPETKQLAEYPGATEIYRLPSCRLVD